jgi:phage shock protein E
MSFLKHHWFKGILVTTLLVITLMLSPVSWSAPQAIAPAVLAHQLQTSSAPLVLDVRSESEYAVGHIPGAINLPYRQVPARLDELAAFQSRDIVIYCEVGVRAGIAGMALEQAGFESILMLEGHMQAWRQAELPIDTITSVPTP